MSGSDTSMQDILANKDLQRYLVDFGTGMAGQRTFADSMGAGLQNAGVGLSQRLSKESETEKRKKMINDVLGTDLSSLTGAELTKKGLELLGTGDPSLVPIGQKLVDSSMKQKPEWSQTTVDIGGRQVPAQINNTTREIKPFSADITNGPKLTYVPDLQTFVDDYGNFNTPRGGAPQMPAGGAQAQQSPIAGLTNQAISGGLTPKAQADLAIWNAKNSQEAAQKVAEEQRANTRLLEQESRKPQNAMELAKAENQAKSYQSALDWLSPDNLAAQKQTNTEMKQNLKDIGGQLEAAHAGPTVLDTPMINKFKRETLGDVPSSNVAANVKNLVATKIGQMKQAGVISAGQLNSDKDIDLQFGAIFDVNAPLETQQKQLAKLNSSLTEADKQIALKTKKAQELVAGKTPAETVQSTQPTTQPTNTKYEEGKVYTTPAGRSFRIVGGKAVAL
jgi:hypothetical protein